MPDIDRLLADLLGPDEAAAEAAASALGEAGKAAEPAVLELLDSQITEHRWWAVRTLAGMASPPLAILTAALSDAESEVRAAAALALAAHPSPDSINALVTALSDEDGLVAVLAVNGLAKIGQQAVPALLEAYDVAPPRGRIQIMRALAELKDHRAIKLMMNALEADSAAIQYWAQEGLERLGLNMVYMKPE